MKQHELLWTEVTASNLRKVDMNDDLDEKAGVNRPGFTLHGGVLSGRPDVNCAVHVHTEIGMAIAGLKHGLRMVSQQAIRFYNRTGYHAYEGITEDFEERARINRDLGQNRALIMHNHGLLTVGKTAREAFVLMKTLIEAADIQLRMEATGGELIEIPSQICESTASQYEKHDSAAARPTGRPFCGSRNRSTPAIAIEWRLHGTSGEAPSLVRLRHRPDRAARFLRCHRWIECGPRWGYCKARWEQVPGSNKQRLEYPPPPDAAGARGGAAVHPVDGGHRLAARQQ